MSWTEEQQDAINLRNTGIVVSAAAGSGKTSVLVERLIGVLSDTVNKTPADRLIVVTFTNDAAAQMKQRLADALSSKIAKEPDNVWLCSQQALLQTAKISTIHSFCFDLIRENIRTLDISAGFRILDETEENLLRKKAVENVFEDYYKHSPAVIGKLADFFSEKGRGDEQLEKIILETHEFLTSIPYYEDWVNEKINFFRNPVNVADDPLANFYIGTLRDFYTETLRKINYLERWINAVFKTTSACVTTEKTDVVNAINKLDAVNDPWKDRVCDASISTTRFTAPDKNIIASDDAARVEFEAMKEFHKKYKNKLNTVSKNVFTLSKIQDDYKVHADVIEMLLKMIISFADELAKLKNEKNALGFSDAEQLTIRLLTKKNKDGEICRTPLAIALSDYYSMIMIDEFQDANNNQDLIFKMLSKNGTPEKGGTNLFVVGDVKQSIYRFRLANPKLFIDVINKSEPYERSKFKGTNAAIYLNKNFRSSEPVINFVNYVFSTIMSRRNGDVDYNANERLVKGLEYPPADRTTEFIVVPEPKDENIVDEPYAVAKKISSMLGVAEVCDKGNMRPCEPRDFCILMRGKKKAKDYVKALAERGIRAHSEEPDGYLESSEISVLINLLAVIDNPMQNIQLVSVLMSPMFMITAEEMALLAVENENRDKYFRVIKKVLNGETQIGKDTALYAKLERFMQLFDKLRYCAASQRLERFIRTIYDSTDFLSAVQVYSDGRQKRANLHLLLDIAESYENNSGGGITGFVRYVNTILKNEGKMHHASTISAADNAVFIKTIHKSKGLEYPFVFLCNTISEFNGMDTKKNFIINSEYGMSFKYHDRANLKRYETFPHTVMKGMEKADLVSEEMRLFYVALTRARERLFITVPEAAKKKYETLKNDIIISGGLTEAIIAKANSMLYWIFAVMLVHPGCSWFRDNSRLMTVSSAPTVNIVPIKHDKVEEAEKQNDEDEEENKKEEKKPEPAVADEKMVKKLKDAFSFSYNSGLTDKSAKITVTEIAKSGGEDKLYLRRPEFAAEKDGLTAAEKGTATHTFMQYADFDAAEKDIASEAERLVEMGLLTEEECRSINLKEVEAFFTSDLYQRLKKSDEVRREQKFLIKKCDASLDDDRLMEYNNNSMLQGIADCMFEEEDGIVIIDYKTDRVNSEGVLVQRYDLQLRLYSAALGSIFDKPVKEAYIYSFALGKEIKVNIK